MKISKHIFLLLAAAIMTGCSEDLLAPDGLQESTATGEPATISATAEQHTAGNNAEGAANGAMHTALLPDRSVVWTAGDQIGLLTAAGTSTQKTLTVELNGRSKGLGIDIGATSSGSVWVRYSYIQVTVGGADVTNTIVSTNDEASNTHKLGIYNSNSRYQYAPAGTAVLAQLSTTGHYIPLVQSSSSSDANLTATVVLRGLEYSRDGQNWTEMPLTEASIKNGTSWGKGNVVYNISGSAAGNYRFTLTGNGGSAEGTFSGTAPEGATGYALYPYSANASLDGTTLRFSLPQEQTYCDGSFAPGANPMAGAYADGICEMKNLCGALVLQLTGTETVTEIRLTDNGDAKLWGEASIAADRIGSEGAAVTGGSSTLTLRCPEGVTLSPDEPTPFYIVVPAGALTSGFTAEVSTFYGTATLSTAKAQTISRSRLQKMGARGLGELTIEEFNIENEAAHNYLLYATTTLSSTPAAAPYTQSYFDQSRSYRPDQPNVKTITWTNPQNASVSICMATDPSYSSTVLSATTTGSSYVLRNFVPGQTYYYKVENGSTLLTAGAFRATGQLRMIAIDKGFNIRDLGGWTGLADHTVRYEQLYRGASLGGSDMYGTTSDITADDKAELKRIGMRAQLDLRAADGGGKYPNELSLHSYTRSNTTLLDADFNNTMTDYGAYNQDASVVSDIAWIIYELKERGKPVYFHCRQGADRTGITAFIIEGLLGCYGTDGRQMGMDYELTGFSQANLVDNKTVETSYRGATEAYGNTSKLFRFLLLNSDLQGSNLQQRCYYYLNQYWHNLREPQGGRTVDLCIDSADLDWFIKYMLNLSDDEYAQYRPTWAAQGGDLKTVAEAKANVVTYAN